MKKKFITSIYNYCDRWCERCAFTHRCKSFAMSEEWQAKNPDKKDDWVAQLSDNFAKAMSIIKQWAEEEGIDLDTLPEYSPPKVSSELMARKTLTIDLIRRYEKLVEGWKKENQESVQLWSEKIYQHRESGITGIEQSFSPTENAFEIISWYFYLIRSKVTRGYSSLEDDFGIEVDPIQNDMNGSVKVAIISIDRSLAAWHVMREHFQEERDTIIDIMVALARAKKRILSEFPHSLQFIRPGFDTNE